MSRTYFAKFSVIWVARILPRDGQPNARTITHNHASVLHAIFQYVGGTYFSDGEREVRISSQACDALLIGMLLPVQFGNQHLLLLVSRIQCPWTDVFPRDC